VEPALPKFGRYQTLGLLGRGGMGTVYRAYHSELRAELAIKVLLSKRGAQEDQRRRFERELRAMSQLRHPGLVEIVDAGEEQGVPWIAMRRVEGGSLDEHLRARGSLPWSEVVELGVQLCEALSVAHARGILHRDLKPDNVLCAPGGRYVVTDFGLTKDLSRETQRLSQTGALLGTPGYWAPEQASGLSKEATAATDVYGVGAVLYTALTGVPPIQGEGLLEIVVATQERPPTPPSSLAEVPAALDALVLRCLEKSQHDRFGSLAELGSELRRVRASGDANSPSSGRGAALGALALALALGVILALGALVWLGEPEPSLAVESPGPSAQPQPSAPLPARSSAAPAPDPLLAAAPSWYRALPEGGRPPVPLPEGLAFGSAPGEYRNRADGSVLLFAPPGSFAMGSEAGKSNERPAHVVTFATGFFVGKFEVTWRQFEEFCRAQRRGVTPSRLIDGRGGGGVRFLANGDHPAFNVSWDDAQAYCRWAGLRLPSEAEWEYSARGPESKDWPWGGESPSGVRLNLADQSADWDWARPPNGTGPQKAPWEDGYSYTAPVGSFPEGASWVGCLDLAGNITEWVQDGYKPGFAGAPRDGSAREELPVGKRLYRGGGWLNTLEFCTPTARGSGAPDVANTALGFRVARSCP
jgi:formylglycine-generating enzyme required for sulfatase activity